MNILQPQNSYQYLVQPGMWGMLIGVTSGTSEVPMAATVTLDLWQSAIAGKGFGVSNRGVVPITRVV